ncbi:cornifin-A-like isoform X2 [Nannospalax galili]|uniref:cornifin-A-like isoform X2 n=1 Tax=Nannospalax galili TaxID=1026970 RepID=UPI0004ED2B38|nr:cornifin-A-like isoform X2 [Nannospalax galili]
MSSYQQKQPFVPPPQPQQHQVKQPCQPPPQGPFVSTEPCHTNVPQPGNTKIPESCDTKVPEKSYTKVPEACPSKDTPSPAQLKTKQK